MIEQDTIRLLRECDAGIKMGVSAIDDVLKYTGSEELKGILIKSKNEHEKLKGDLQLLLNEYHDDGKEPAAMAKGMSWLKTNVKLTLNESDSVVADLITEGCSMGIKSLARYQNEYEAADEKSKKLAGEIIKLEESLVKNMRKFL